MNFNNLKPRKIVNKILTKINNKRIILLLGSRQSGKTSILRILMKKLLKSGTLEKNIFYLDLEDFSILEICEKGAIEFIRYLETKGLNKNSTNYVFIDEIQYLKNPSNFLKLLVDHHPYIKLIVSGSSSFEIRQKFKDSLAGRKEVFEVHTLDFQEFLEFKEKNNLLKLINKNNFYNIILGEKFDFSSLKFYKDEINTLYNEYLLFGGYPAVVLENNYEDKISILNEINNSYIRKDIKDLLRIDNILAFNNLLKLLSIRVGNLINITDVSSNLRITRETVERYLFILENTFIIKSIFPCFKNRNKEITKMNKIYFYDMGLRNILLKNFNALNDRTDAGSLFENSIFSELIKNIGMLDELYFWRTQSKNEVDFILKKDNFYPIEVKYNISIRFKITSGIKYFSEDYNCNKAFIATAGNFELKKINGIKVYFIPAWLI